MAPAAVRQVHAILHPGAGSGGPLGLDSGQPSCPRQPTPTWVGEIRPPTPEEVSRLLEAAYEADLDFAVLLWLAATTGARRGELCALRWAHVDLEAAERRVAEGWEDYYARELVGHFSPS